MADTITAQQIMERLQGNANYNKSYADKLKETRESRMKEVTDWQNASPMGNEFSTPGGIPLNPSDVIKSGSFLTKSLNNILDPYSVDNEMKARGAETDILQKIYELGQADKKLEDAGTTIEDVLAKQKALKDAGYDTSAIDKEIQDVYGIKKSGPDMTKVYEKISTLPQGKLTPINDFTAITKELARLNKSLSGEASTAGASYVSGSTGPLATTIGDLLQPQDKRQLRTDIDTFQDMIRKDLFGSAFTETEKKSAQLPSSAKQEYKNRQIIESLFKRKLEGLKTNLRNSGLSQEEITTYLQSEGIEDGGVKSPEVKDTLGIL
jgi:hypothetical protein